MGCCPLRAAAVAVCAAGFVPTTCRDDDNNIAACGDEYEARDEFEASLPLPTPPRRRNCADEEDALPAALLLLLLF